MKSNKFLVNSEGSLNQLFKLSNKYKQRSAGRNTEVSIVDAGDSIDDELVFELCQNKSYISQKPTPSRVLDIRVSDEDRNKVVSMRDQIHKISAQDEMQLYVSQQKLSKAMLKLNDDLKKQTKTITFSSIIDVKLPYRNLVAQFTEYKWKHPQKTNQNIFGVIELFLEEVYKVQMEKPQLASFCQEILGKLLLPAL